MSVYTATLRGVDIGVGTSYEWVTAPQGLGGGTYRTSRLELQSADGIRNVGPDLLAARDLTFDVQMLGSASEIETLADDLRQAWAPVTSGVVSLSLTLANSERILYGRPVVSEVDFENLYHGLGRAMLTFEASDPRMFSATESALTLGLSDPGGLEFPLTFPLTFGAAGDSDGPAVNDGTYETDWTATIVGPVTNPKILLGNTGEYVEMTGTVPSGSTLTVSSADRSILLNGSPRQSWLTLPSRWWKLAAGSNTVRFRADSGTGTVTIAWRSAWL